MAGDGPMKFHLVRVCDAEHPSGNKCEKEVGHDGAHYYTVWTHPNQYGSNPKYRVHWQETD